MLSYLCFFYFLFILDGYLLTMVNCNNLFNLINLLTTFISQYKEIYSRIYSVIKAYTSLEIFKCIYSLVSHCQKSVFYQLFLLVAVQIFYSKCYNSIDATLLSKLVLYTQAGSCSIPYHFLFTLQTTFCLIFNLELNDCFPKKCLVT